MFVGQFRYASDFKSTLRDQLASQFDPLIIVHTKQSRGTSTNRSNTDNACGANDEMVSPMLSPRIKKIGSLARSRIDTGKICAFAHIAAYASPAQVVVTIVAAVLSRNDVLHVKRPLIGIVGQSTIFTARFSPTSDEIASRFAHCSTAVFSEIAASLGLEQGNEVTCINEFLQLIAFLVGERTIVALAR